VSLVACDAAQDDFAYLRAWRLAAIAGAQNPANLAQRVTQRLGAPDEIQPQQIRPAVAPVAVGSIPGGSEQPEPRVVTHDLAGDAGPFSQFFHEHVSVSMDGRADQATTPQSSTCVQHLGQ
jgi:hypothetical protein